MKKDTSKNYTYETNETCGILMEKIICEISNIPFQYKKKLH